MGRAFIEGFLSQGVEREVALGYHLQYNHYPPVSKDFVPACIKAIDAGNEAERDRNWDIDIELPNGKIRKASQIIDGLHLDAFFDNYDDEEYEDEEEE